MPIADTKRSKRTESDCKDVECFFGILKGSFRILKLPILFRKRSDIDNMFFTCCTLHATLHSFDGLDELEAGVQWAGEDGQHDMWIADPTTDVTSVGLGGIGAEKDEKVEVEPGHDVLKRQLITPFMYRYEHNDITRLTR